VSSAQNSGAIALNTGKEIYDAACLACHGPEGKGQPDYVVGFEKPDTFPDFTRCDQTTPEDNYAWKQTIRDGGRGRGLSQIMPSFRDALTSGQMDKVIEYVRGFCSEKGWPRGELNLPRALITEKAYPEDEVVVSTSVNAQHTPGVSNEIVHEQRFGKLNQIEISVPVDFVNQNHTWYGGFGDIGLGLKRVLFSSLHTGSIVSVEGLANLPTGSTTHGLGEGTPSFESFASYGQLFHHDFSIQEQFGSVLPKDTSKSPQSIYWRNAFGKSFHAGQGLGRLWTPMLEWVANRDLVDRARMKWDIVPEMQVTISRRQHIRADLGVSIPVTNTAGRSTQILFYVLWDWQDGKLTEGW
jgi:mono/diheme cytochrome c family protein